MKTLYTITSILMLACNIWCFARVESKLNSLKRDSELAHVYNMGTSEMHLRLIQMDERLQRERSIETAYNGKLTRVFTPE